MFDPKTLDQLAQALVARIIPQLQNGGGNGDPPGASPFRNGTKPLPKRLLTIKEAAAYLGRSVSAVYHLVARGELACVRHGRNLRFDLDELNRWIERDKT
jgi:excisionase family DNA binding protein